VDGGFETEGSTDLDDIFERFGLEAPPQGEDEDFDSVGGMILQRIGRFPAAGEEVRLDYGELSFTVLDSGERRIERVLCRKAEPGQATSTH
ncbi:MAG: transporter associated domain-containing protein, partial [Pygmaiobacter sp.]